MAPIFYRKLVRDGIPQIIERDGKRAVVSTLSQKEKLFHLRLKLLEEAHELFCASDSAEFTKEAADVLEVIMALASIYRVSMPEIEAMRAKRAAGRGAFEDSIYLHAVYEADELQGLDAEAVAAAEGFGALLTPFVVSNSSTPSLIELLKQELAESIQCQIATAFLTPNALNRLKRPIEEFLRRGGKLELLTSIMNDFNSPETLVHFAKLHSEAELKVFYPILDPAEPFKEPPPPFHLKCFLFTKKDGRNSLIIGSSNLTGGGLGHNEEWNYFSNSEVNLSFAETSDETVFEQAKSRFCDYWQNSAIIPNDEFLSFYRNRFKAQANAQYEVKKLLLELNAKNHPQPKPKPRPAQRQALEALQKQRANGIKKTAIIAATGLGKTHLAAFDFAQSGHKSILFLVHRENILAGAMQTFREVLCQPSFGAILSGNTDNLEREIIAQKDSGVFAMVQTLSRQENLELFSKNHFDYIVFDEFHHGEAPSYKKIFDYFEPSFFLGLTATPERLDGRDVLALCDYNVAFEMRLFQAIDQAWLTPFQYYAIYDETDYEQVRWTGTGYDEGELEAALSQDTRAELIIRNLRGYLPAFGQKTRALAFCANKGHARFMAAAFNRAGIGAQCLLGESTVEEREAAIRELQDEDARLEVLCSVDILGEGVDIPLVSHVLFLRPTESPTVLLQQLGRGLRSVEGKDFLVALDFVGNFKKSYIVPTVFGAGGAGCGGDSRALMGPMAFRLPAGCYVDVDRRVARIWDAEIRRRLQVSPEETLREAFGAVKGLLGRVPRLLDFIDNPEVEGGEALLEAFGKWRRGQKDTGSWLRLKERLGHLSEYEASLLGTAGEDFLQHVEGELKATRSYKMVILKALLADEEQRASWSIEWIAKGFRRYYLANLEHLSDCSAFDKSKDPQSVPMRQFERLLMSMPLDKLSNTADKYFILDKKNRVFKLKDEMSEFWADDQFRALVLDRTEYALHLYFKRFKKRQEAKTAEAEKLDDVASNKIVPSEATPKEAMPIIEPELIETLVLPFYSDLRVAAGSLNKLSAGEPAKESIEVPKELGYKDDKHFVARITGDSMDGGKIPIADGSLVVLEPITATSAGSVNGQVVAVMQVDEFGDTSYALKKIEKRQGQYYLVSFNKAYKDVLIDVERVRPFARFKGILP
jgi:superfamily II DNA or RNA helicase/predicted house-cleaning noncanonical NTP pyrophosphatase (MazG superfamily)/HKD family nuclease/SOS-response transcriptional repressor LexA